MQALERLPKHDWRELSRPVIPFPSDYGKNGASTALKTRTQSLLRSSNRSRNEQWCSWQPCLGKYWRQFWQVASIGWMQVSQQESLEMSTLARYLFETKVRRKITLPVVVSSSRTSKNNCLFFRENFFDETTQLVESILRNMSRKSSVPFPRYSKEVCF